MVPIQQSDVETPLNGRKPSSSMSSLTVMPTSTRHCDISALGETTLIQSARNSYTGAWYVREPKQCAGVAAFKAFGKEGATDTYTFELVGMGGPQRAQQLRG